jgi:hypothetical protein
VKKVVSFSLYGTDFLYLVGALQNAAHIRRALPDWTPIFHISATVPESTRSKLQNLGAQVVISEAWWPQNEMLWRLLPFLDKRNDCIILRDADSRISTRERAALLDWEESGLPVHIMRDHPYHGVPILGGMWGAERWFIEPLLDLRTLRTWPRDKGADQEYLEKEVYPKVKRRAKIHDSFFMFEPGSRRSFPTPRDPSGAFVGEVIQADGNPIQAHRRVLLEIEGHRFKKFTWAVRTHISGSKHRIFRRLDARRHSVVAN